MRKFYVDVHFDVVMPVEIEAVNEADALEQASKFDFDSSKEYDVFNGKSCVTDTEEREGDYEDTIEKLVDECMEARNRLGQNYSKDELTKAVYEFVDFDDEWFDGYNIDDIIDEVYSIAERNRENLEKTMDKCRNNNF